jgi:hypothetical protein
MRYEFRGGPFDGTWHTVDLMETNRGLEPAEIRTLYETPSPTVRALDVVAPVNITVQTYQYKFVPDDGCINQGHYSFCEPS